MIKYMPAVKELLDLAITAQRTGSRLGLAKLSKLGGQLHGFSYRSELSEPHRLGAIKLLPTLLPVIDGHIRHVRNDDKRERLKAYRNEAEVAVTSLYNRLTVEPQTKAAVSEVMDCLYKLGYQWSQERSDSYVAIEAIVISILGGESLTGEALSKFLELACEVQAFAADTGSNRELKPKLEAGIERLEVLTLMHEVTNG